MHRAQPDDIHSEIINTLEGNLKRFRRFGKVISRTAKNLSGEVAKIGRLEREDHNISYIIFYPDGTFDRFDDVSDVQYRTGWDGPDLGSKFVNKDLIEEIIVAEEEITSQAKSTRNPPKRIMSDAARARKREKDRERYHAKKISKTLH